MKKRNLNLLLAVTFGLFLSLGNANGQGLKGLINKVAENETLKRTVNAIKTDSTVIRTVQAVKASVQETVAAKVQELTTPKSAEVATVPVKAPAQALAPDVKNAISDVRAFTGLTAADLDAKLKTLGFAVGKDDLALGGIVYTSKTAGYILSVTMGTRNSISYVREVIKATVTKKAKLATTKAAFLKLGTQTTDLKAQFSSASIVAKNAKGTNLTVESAAIRTSKFLPALDKFTTKKENGTVTDAYGESDYDYQVKMTQTTTKNVSTVITTIKVTDLTADPLVQ